MSNTPPNNPMLTFYQQWSDKTPFITRVSTIFMIAIYLSSFFFPLEIYFGNVPFFTIRHFEIYRLVLSPIVGNGIISMILIIMTYPSMGQRVSE
jgi:hypothetical protein